MLAIRMLTVARIWSPSVDLGIPVELAYCSFWLVFDLEDSIKRLTLKGLSTRWIVRSVSSKSIDTISIAVEIFQRGPTDYKSGAHW